MSTASSPNLRLVADDDPASVAAWRAEEGAVARETRAAAANRSLAPTDARWVLAARTASLLQGPVLTPDRRRTVLRTADRLGIRLFDANLIIAIVQDQARRGEELGNAVPTLAMVPAPKRRSRRLNTLRWIAAFATALAVNALLIRWLVS
ncbi:MAG: hypothetical protein KJO43_15830 [Phycisphaerae bacterium]|nr:hypothetical protein [Phycisphaerae bacterium]